MKIARVISIAATCVVLSSITASAQVSPPRRGGAEKSMKEKGWPYIESAVQGATGYTPNFSAYTELNERWDIYVNILWRGLDYAMPQFMESLEPDVRKRFGAAKGDLRKLVRRIRAKQVKLPYQDSISGCLLFMANRQNRTDLAANDCK